MNAALAPCGFPRGAGWLTGFEPATSGTTIRRSNQLSYSHHRAPEAPPQTYDRPARAGR